MATFFKPGDKVVCIDDTGCYPNVKVNNIYIVDSYQTTQKSKISKSISYLILKDLDFFFDTRRFISLKEYRRIKLKKIGRK